MLREHHRWYSHRLGRDMDILVYGHYGSPIVAFPTSGGDHREYEGQGMIEAIAHHIDAGKVKSLAFMSDKPSALYPNIPLLKAATGSNWTMAAWRGMAAPKGLPPEARDKLAAAIKKVAASKEYNDFMAQRGFGVVYLPPEEFATFMKKSDDDLGATMKAVGIVK